MVADVSTGTRRFASFKIKSEALAEADRLARKKASLATMVQSITNAQAIDYFNAVDRLKPFNVSVDAATSTVADCLKDAGSLDVIREAVKFYRLRHRKVVNKRVAEVVADLLKVKKSRGASGRYLKDLSSRLGMFAEAFQINIGNVTTPKLQTWLDNLKLSAQSVRNFRTVLNLFFTFAIARGYAVDNPVAGGLSIKY
jgi:hypothetical protein